VLPAALAVAEEEDEGTEEELPPVAELVGAADKADSSLPVAVAWEAERSGMLEVVSPSELLVGTRVGGRAGVPRLVAKPLASVGGGGMMEKGVKDGPGIRGASVEVGSPSCSALACEEVDRRTSRPSRLRERMEESMAVDGKGPLVNNKAG